MDKTFKAWKLALEIIQTVIEIELKAFSIDMTVPAKNFKNIMLTQGV